MPIDYQDAAKRHFYDAELLYRKCRLANADYLYGIAAECVLKAVMVGLKASIDNNGSITKPYRVHIDKLWSEFCIFSGNRQGAHYVQMLPSVSPFDNWNMSRRYCAEIYFSIPEVATHRSAAITTMKVLQQAIVDGVL